MRRRLWGYGIGAAVAVGIALWIGLRDRQNLLDRSTPIASVYGWGLLQPKIDMSLPYHDLLVGGAQYQWVGDRQILFFHGLLQPQQIILNYAVPGGRSYGALYLPPPGGTPT